jgi:hypothetical protein
MKMNQPGTDKGIRHETGEKEPKGVAKADTRSERREGMKAGVAMGKADGIGMRPSSHMGKQDGLVGELNNGKTEGHFYHHKRIPHEQGK